MHNSSTVAASPCTLPSLCLGGSSQSLYATPAHNSLSPLQPLLAWTKPCAIKLSVNQFSASCTFYTVTTSAWVVGYSKHVTPSSPLWLLGFIKVSGDLVCHTHRGEIYSSADRRLFKLNFCLPQFQCGIFCLSFLLFSLHWFFACVCPHLFVFSFSFISAAVTFLSLLERNH